MCETGLILPEVSPTALFPWAEWAPKAVPEAALQA